MSKEEEFVLNKTRVAVATMIAAAVISLIVVFATWTTIPPGHVGVVQTWGELSEKTLPPGLHFIAPWRSVLPVDCRQQIDQETSSIPSAEGLACQLGVSCWWRIDPDAAVRMHKEVGGDYEAKIVDPYIRSVLRDTTKDHNAEAIYTTKREEVETRLKTLLTPVLMERGIIVDDIKLTTVTPPASVTSRIEAKVAADQDAKRMEFVLRQKELEAKAKVAEARGIAESQEIIQNKLTPLYVQYKWIEALTNHPGAIVFTVPGAELMNAMAMPRAK